MALEGLTPTFCRHRGAEGYLSCVMSVARIAAQQVGYFENTVTGKITKPWVVVF